MLNYQKKHTHHSPPKQNKIMIITKINNRKFGTVFIIANKIIFLKHARGLSSATFEQDDILQETINHHLTYTVKLKYRKRYTCKDLKVKCLSVSRWSENWVDF